MENLTKARELSSSKTRDHHSERNSDDSEAGVSFQQEVSGIV